MHILTFEGFGYISFLSGGEGKFFLEVKLALVHRKNSFANKNNVD